MNTDPYYSRVEVSNSDLSDLNKLLNPAIYDFDYEQALKFGTLVDALITEPERINVYKKTIDDEPYSVTDYELAKKMKMAFYADPTCNSFMKLATCQHVSVGEVEYEFAQFKFKLKCRAKWDLMMFPLKMGADIKTTTATSQKQFEDACEHFNYFRSRVYYMKLENTKKDMLIGISKVNGKIFKIPITINDKYWQKGLAQASELCFHYWHLFSGFTELTILQ